ncbi:MAG: hypothetical protein JNL82_12795 [Myxococcales bacterium]|nr:hypothetical protein [Myxococcales bacterium]
MPTREELRAFLARPWDRLRVLKDQHNAATIEREGVEAAFRLAASLRAHAKAMGAEPSPADREADLAAAVRLRRLLDRGGRRP